jgi:uncharacterized membrane protein
MSDMTPPPAPPMPPQMPMTPPMSMGGPSSNSRLIALLGWIFAPFGIIAIFLDDYKHDLFVRSHVIQAAAVALAVWVLDTILIATVILSPLTFFIWLAAIIYQIFMAIQAYNGKTMEVPVVYGLVKSFIEQP